MEAMLFNKEINMNQYQNDKPKIYESKWSGTYNGEEGKMDIETNNNGDRQGIHVEFTNDDLDKMTDLFSMPVAKKTIDQQLRDDFDMQIRKPIIEDQQLGKLMINQIMKEEMHDPFPIIISKSNMKLLRPHDAHPQQKYLFLTNKRRTAEGNKKTKGKRRKPSKTMKTMKTNKSIKKRKQK